MAEKIGDRDKDTMHPLKWKCTMSVASSLVKKYSISVEDKVVVPNVHCRPSLIVLIQGVVMFILISL